MAKKGAIKRWHFSHLNFQPGDNCAESAIHAAAKQVLLEHRAFVVPEFAIRTSARAMDGREFYEHQVLSPVRSIRFDRTVPEVAIGDIRPDVVGYRGERRLLVEMHFRHRVDLAKREKMIRLGLPAIEIDLSDLDADIGFAAVTERVITAVHEKVWLFYPGQDEHLAYLEHKLRERVETANEKYHKEIAQRKVEQENLAALVKAQQVSQVEFDTAFSLWKPHEQAAWLRQQLGLTDVIPAFLSRQSYPATVIKVPSFHFQASIFEHFIYEKAPGNRLTARVIFPCLRRRFNIPLQEGTAYILAINLYLEYLTHARFLHRDSHSKMEGPYYVEHSQLSLPIWSHPDTQYDGQPSLSTRAIGTGQRRCWTNRWPRWHVVMEEAGQFLASSPNRDVLLTALTDINPMKPPPSPHHWAEPLLQQDVELKCCFELLGAVGLLRD